MHTRINYLTKDIYNICEEIIKNNNNFTIEVDKKKDIKLLSKTIPSLIGERNKTPSLLAMFWTTIKFSDILSIIGYIHQQKNYTISYENDEILLLHFNSGAKLKRL